MPESGLLPQGAPAPWRRDLLLPGSVSTLVRVGRQVDFSTAPGGSGFWTVPSRGPDPLSLNPQCHP